MQVNNSNLSFGNATLLLTQDLGHSRAIERLIKLKSPPVRCGTIPIRGDDGAGGLMLITPNDWEEFILLDTMKKEFKLTDKKIANNYLGEGLKKAIDLRA